MHEDILGVTLLYHERIDHQHAAGKSDLRAERALSISYRPDLCS